MSLKTLVPRSLVRIKNEALLTIRYRVDARFRALSSSELAGAAVTYLTSAGLANRIRAHYIASIVARRTGRRLVPIWMPTQELASDGNDLLAHTVPPRGNSRRSPVRMTMADVTQLPALATSAAHTGRLLVLDFDAQWVPITRARQMLNHVDAVALHVRSDVIAAAEHILAGLVAPVLAVHVRQTDFVTHTPFAKSMSYFSEKIAEVIERRAGPGFRTLLVASDDRVALDPQLAAKFERVVTLTPAYTRAQPGVASEALAHLLALSRGDEFVASPHSSFSELVVAIREQMLTIDDTAVAGAARTTGS